MAAGKTDAEIAVRLGGSRKQIAEQRARLLAKLGITAQRRSPAQRSDLRTGAPTEALHNAGHKVFLSNGLLLVSKYFSAKRA
ncbi:hypothetical protein D6B98_35085 [Bradyrhizobium sp. LVM 105]|nr:hypothetical protein D6B98_35085 [Bradyrhizobium sp. LVM 105]